MILFELGAVGGGPVGGVTRRVLYSRRRYGYTNALRTRTSAPIGTAHPLEVARSGANLVAPGSASPRRVGPGHRRGRGVPPTFGLKQNPNGKEKFVARFAKNCCLSGCSSPTLLLLLE